MRELEVFAESSGLVASTLDLGEVLDRLAGIARARLGVDVVRIWLRDEAPGDLILRAQTGTRRQDVAFQTRLAPGAGRGGPGRGRWRRSRRSSGYPRRPWPPPISRRCSGPS